MPTPKTNPAAIRQTDVSDFMPAANSIIDLIRTELIPHDASLESAICQLEKAKPTPSFSCKTTRNATHYHRYMQKPNAPNVVLLHPLGGNCNNWIQIIEDLRSDYTIYAVDLPGHGKTTAQVTTDHHNKYINWLETFISDITIKSVHLVGFSFGGRIAAHYADTHNDSVASLTLFAPALSPATTGLVAGQAWLIDHFAERTADVIKRATIKLILKSMKTSDDEFVKTGLAIASENLLLDQEPLNYTGITSSLRWLYDEPGDEINWASLAAHMPVNILFGEKDTYCPVEHSGLLNLPDLHLTLIPGRGHLLPLEEPAICEAAIRASVRGILYV